MTATSAVCGLALYGFHSPSSGLPFIYFTTANDDMHTHIELQCVYINRCSRPGLVHSAYWRCPEDHTRAGKVISEIVVVIFTLSSDQVLLSGTFSGGQIWGSLPIMATNRMLPLFTLLLFALVPLLILIFYIFSKFSPVFSIELCFILRNCILNYFKMSLRYPNWISPLCWESFIFN